MKTVTPYCVRHGDVLLVDAAYRGGMPATATEEQTKGRVILAHGEVTGHAHAIEDCTKVRVFDAAAERFLQISEKVALSHEEHSTIMLNKGRLQQAFQVEDFGEEVRRVAD